MYLRVSISWETLLRRSAHRMPYIDLTAILKSVLPYISRYSTQDMALMYNMLPFLLDDEHFTTKMLEENRNCGKCWGKNPQTMSEKSQNWHVDNPHFFPASHPPVDFMFVHLCVYVCVSAWICECVCVCVSIASTATTLGIGASMPPPSRNSLATSHLRHYETLLTDRGNTE